MAMQFIDLEDGDLLTIKTPQGSLSALVFEGEVILRGMAPSVEDNVPKLIPGRSKYDTVWFVPNPARL